MLDIARQKKVKTEIYSFVEHIGDMYTLYRFWLISIHLLVSNFQLF